MIFALSLLALPALFNLCSAHSMMQRLEIDGKPLGVGEGERDESSVRKHAHGPSCLLLAVRLVANNAGVLDVSSPDMSWSATIS